MLACYARLRTVLAPIGVLMKTCLFDATNYKPIEDMVKTIQYAYKLFTCILKTVYKWNTTIKSKFIQALKDFSQCIDRSLHDFISHVFSDDVEWKKAHLIKARNRTKAKLQKQRLSEGETG